MIVEKKVGNRILKVDDAVKEFVELKLDDYYWLCSFIPENQRGQLKKIAKSMRIRQISEKKRGKLNARLF